MYNRPWYVELPPDWFLTRGIHELDKDRKLQKKTNKPSEFSHGPGRVAKGLRHAPPDQGGPYRPISPPVQFPPERYVTEHLWGYTVNRARHPNRQKRWDGDLHGFC